MMLLMMVVAKLALQLESVMSKLKLSYRKLSLVNILFLGFFILGIRCISWGMISIRSQSSNSYILGHANWAPFNLI